MEGGGGWLSFLFGPPLLLSTTPAVTVSRTGGLPANLMEGQLPSVDCPGHSHGGGRVP